VRNSGSGAEMSVLLLESVEGCACRRRLESCVHLFAGIGLLEDVGFFCGGDEVGDVVEGGWEVGDAVFG